MAAFRRYGGVTIKWLILVAEDLLMSFPENRRSKTIYSFSGEQVYGAITGKIEWQEKLAVMGTGISGRRWRDTMGLRIPVLPAGFLRVARKPDESGRRCRAISART